MHNELIPCPKCNHEIDSSYNLCPFCGTKIDITNIQNSQEVGSFSNNSNSVFIFNNDKKKSVPKKPHEPFSLKWLTIGGISGAVMGLLVGTVVTLLATSSLPLKTNNSTKKDSTNESKTTFTTEVSVDETNQDKSQSNTNNKSSLNTVAPGETFEIKTENGDFKISIDNAHKVDWAMEDDVQAVAIQCSIENISFSGQVYPDVLNGYDLGETFTYIKAKDQDGFNAQYYGVSGPTDGAYAVGFSIPIGDKSKVSYPFNFGLDVESVTVIINDEYEINLPV